MTLSNPNRFVTGLSDISYVKQVNRAQTTRRKDQIVVEEASSEPQTVQEKNVAKDRFVGDAFTPEVLPDNASEL